MHPHFAMETLVNHLFHISSTWFLAILITYQRRHQEACEMSFAFISQPFGELSNTVLSTAALKAQGRRRSLGTVVFGRYNYQQLKFYLSVRVDFN